MRKDRLLAEYVPWDPLDPTDRRTRLLDCTELPVVGDVGRWWVYTMDHMERLVAVVYPNPGDLQRDVVATEWIRESTRLRGFRTDVEDRVRLPTLLALVFLSQVRHQLLSNETTAHIFRWYTILQPGPTSVSQASRLLMVLNGTSKRWVPMIGGGFEQLIDHILARGVMTDFYRGLGPKDILARSIRHPMALPVEMDISTGV